MLMLVHVSSREEDLCETMCSLNFATRVSSIRLGKKEESKEAKAEKEVQIANLQQKMKWIENKCKQISREIKRLNSELDNLTGATPSSYEKLDTSHEFEEQQSTADNMKTSPSYIANLPRFMRSTICSRRRKSKVNHHATDHSPTRKKKSALRLTESVSLPINNKTDCKSERSASRISLWTSSKPKLGADNETECSQEISETDTLMSEFSAKSIRTSSKNDEFEIRPHLQKMENVQTSYRHRNKRVMVIPTPENKRYTTSIDTLNCLSSYKNADNGDLVKQMAFGTVLSSGVDTRSSSRNMENETRITNDDEKEASVKNSVGNADESDEEVGTVTYDSISAESTSWFSIVNEKIEILYASVLLGLGFQDLGLADDFFHALVN